MWRDLFNTYGGIIFYGLILVVAEVVVGVIIYLPAWLIIRRSALDRRIPLAYSFFTISMASVSTVSIYTALVIEGQMNEDFILIFVWWTFFFNCLSLVTMLLNLLPVEIAMKKFFPQGRRYYSIICGGLVMAANFLSFLILSLTLPLYQEGSDVGVIDPKGWAYFYPYPLSGIVVGLVVFYYLMQNVPPRGLAKHSTPKGSNSASPEIAG